MAFEVTVVRGSNSISSDIILLSKKKSNLIFFCKKPLQAKSYLYAYVERKKMKYVNGKLSAIVSWQN